jgi:hypothetical protein
VNRGISLGPSALQKVAHEAITLDMFRLSVTLRDDEQVLGRK